MTDTMTTTTTPELTTAPTPQVIVNRGTGAGGAQTNGNGLAWEERTSNERNLAEKFGFTRTSLGAGKTMYYLCKRFENVQVVFTTQHGLKKILKDSHDVTLGWNPDEAYIIQKNGKTVLKILEKKHQNTAGSVDTKLLAGPMIRDSYKITVPSDWDVEYAFCVNNYFRNNVFNNDRKHIQKLLAEQNIPIFYGEDADYFEKLNSWIGLPPHEEHVRTSSPPTH